MTIRALQEAFASWSAAGEPLVLATVFATEGSTYSKAGARMLIAGDGRFRGILSGGCLEGDLALRAHAVLESRESQSVTYDLRVAEDGDVWGLGVGCDGVIRVFLQPLSPEDGYQPFAAMARVFSGERAGWSATAIRSALPALPAGSTAVVAGEDSWWFRIPPAHREAVARAAAEALAAGPSGVVPLTLEGADVRLLCARLEPPPCILVLGAGLDAEPVVRLAGELGWRVTVQDHRPAYIAKGNFTGAEAVLNLPAGELGKALDWSRYAAAIVMSHHLETDRQYLAQLAATPIPYIGLLGPRNRRHRLLTDLGEAAARLAPRLHGPAGLDIGGEGPAPIALSILAEMHATLVGPNKDTHRTRGLEPGHPPNPR